MPNGQPVVLWKYQQADTAGKAIGKPWINSRKLEFNHSLPTALPTFPQALQALSSSNLIFIYIQLSTMQKGTFVLWVDNNPFYGVSLGCSNINIATARMGL